jgi:hypothetical protein
LLIAEEEIKIAIRVEIDPVDAAASSLRIGHATFPGPVLIAVIRSNEELIRPFALALERAYRAEEVGFSVTIRLAPRAVVTVDPSEGSFIRASETVTSAHE